MRSYTLGSELVFSTQFIDPVTRSPVAPASVTLQLIDPNGLTASPTLQNPAVGTYKGVLIPGVAGVWRVRWAGVGGVAAASEFEFEIRPTAFGGVAPPNS